MDPTNIDTNAQRLAKLVDNDGSNNYAHWSAMTKLRLQYLGLWKYVEGPESVKPVVPAIEVERQVECQDEDGSMKMAILDGNEEEVKEAERKAQLWTHGDLAVQLLLIEAVPPSQFTLISLSTTGKEAWYALETEYKHTSFLHAKMLRRRILDFRCKPDMIVSKWLDKMRELYRELVYHNTIMMPDDSFATTIVELLPTYGGWDAFSSALRYRMMEAVFSGKPMAAIEVIHAIKDEEWRQSMQDDDVFARAYSLDSIRRKQPAVVLKQPSPPSTSRTYM
jgi:hypothetical protein